MEYCRRLVRPSIRALRLPDAVGTGNSRRVSHDRPVRRVHCPDRVAAARHAAALPSPDLPSHEQSCLGRGSIIVDGGVMSVLLIWGLPSGIGRPGSWASISRDSSFGFRFSGHAKSANGAAWRAGRLAAPCR